LTGWTYAKLKKQGFSYAKVCDLLSQRGALNRLVLTDSDNELERIAQQCQMMGLTNPFGSGLQNVATLFALATQQNKNLNLEQMLAHVGLTFEGKPHRAVDDAVNIARLFITLMQAARTGIAPYCNGSDQD
jgi:inhibitor of KinA sporulation pathway (predicted exonuclease)